MIRSFRDKLTEELYHGVRNRKVLRLPDEVRSTCIRKLDQLNASVDINDLRIPPGNRLEKLKGDLKTFHSIRVNDQFRIIFEWKNGDAFNVSILDYH